MASARHTPGPWKAERTRLAREAGGGHFHRIFGNGELIAQTMRCAPDDREAQEADAADARLIAAASDLLAALKALVCAVDGGEECIEDERLAACRAAIARAEGLAS